MTVHPIPPTACQYCGRVVVSVESRGRDEPPQVGDPWLCKTCARVSTFGPGLELVRPSPAELSRILRGPEGSALFIAQRVILARPGSSRAAHAKGAPGG